MYFLPAFSPCSSHHSLPELITPDPLFFLPFFFFFLYRNIAIPRVEKRRNRARAAPDFWFFGYFLIFSNRLCKRPWAQVSLVEFKISLLKSNENCLGLVLHMHNHSRRVHWHVTKSCCSTRVQVDPCLDRHSRVTYLFLHSPMAEEWDESSPFCKALVSTLTPSARYVFTYQKALIKTTHSINTVLYLCLFITLPPTSYLHYSSTHVLPYLEWKSIGIRHTPHPISDFLAIFSSSQTASANVHEPRYHWILVTQISKSLRQLLHWPGRRKRV